MARLYQALSIGFFTIAILFSAVAVSRADSTTYIAPCQGGCAQAKGQCNNPGVGCDDFNMCTCVQTKANPAMGIKASCDCTPPAKPAY